MSRYWLRGTSRSPASNPHPRPFSLCAGRRKFDAKHHGTYGTKKMARRVWNHALGHFASDHNFSGIDDEFTVDREGGGREGEVDVEGRGILATEVAVCAEGDEELAVDVDVDQGPAYRTPQFGVETDADVAD